MNVYQALLLKPNEGQSDLPLTRGDWYSKPETLTNLQGFASEAG